MRRYRFVDIADGRYFEASHSLPLADRLDTAIVLRYGPIRIIVPWLSTLFGYGAD